MSDSGASDDRLRMASAASGDAAEHGYDEPSSGDGRDGGDVGDAGQAATRLYEPSLESIWMLVKDHLKRSISATQLQS